MSDLARAAIRRLRTGVVPAWQFENLSVGYEQAKKRVDLSLGDLEGSRPLEPLFVKGEWGTGKTHFLSFVSNAAINRGFACARIDLNARGAALSHPQRFLPFLADELRTRNTLGIRNFMYDALGSDSTRNRILTYAMSGDAGDLQWPLWSVCASYEAGERLELGNHSAWRALQGADLCWSDHGSKREKALARLEALAGLCRAVDFKGLVLVFDEAETIDQLWNVRSRLSAYSVLDRLCKMRGGWCVFSVTDRFERVVERDIDYVAVNGPPNPDAQEFLQHWRDRRFSLMRPPTINAGSARALARAVVSLYSDAYENVGISETAVHDCLDEWGRNPGRNPRRLVRSLIHALDLIRPLGA